MSEINQRKTEYNFLTVYAHNDQLKMEDIAMAMPQNYWVNVVDDWIVEKEYQVTAKNKRTNIHGKPEMETKKKIRYHGVLLIDKKSVKPLRTYSRLEIHRNIFPRDFEDPKSLYVRMNPKEKEEIQRLLGAFAKASNTKAPKYVPKNGFGFYQFESDEMVPAILGMLRNYSILKDATMKYARVQNKTPRSYVAKKPKDSGDIVFVEVGEDGEEIVENRGRDKKKPNRRWKTHSGVDLVV
jgi:hypothetical protein